MEQLQNGLSIKMTPFQACLMGRSTYASFLVHCTDCWSSLLYDNQVKCYVKGSWINNCTFVCFIFQKLHRLHTVLLKTVNMASLQPWQIHQQWTRRAA